MPTDALSLTKQLKALSVNDEKALQELYQTNYKQVERYVLQNSGSEDEAKDVYQDAFIAVWRNIRLNKFELREGSSVDAYLIQVAKYKWLDQLRHKAVKENIILPAESSDMMTIEESNDIEVQRIKTIREKFRQLGDNCKALLMKFYYDRQSLKEIAKAFNWTEATAKNNKYRCMEKLKSLVKDKK